MIEAPDAGSVAAIGAAIGEVGKAIASAASLGKGLSTYEVKVNEVSESDGAGMDAEQIMDILHNLDTQGLTEAASAHEQLSAKLQQVADKLVQNAQTLSSSWQGSAAQAAMDKFQTMHTQTAQLAAQAKQTSNTLNWMAGRMEHYKALPTPVAQSATASDEQTGASIGNSVGGASGAALGDAVGAVAGAFGIGGGAAKAKANAQAQKYMQALSKEIVAGNQALPNTIGAPPASTGTSTGTAHGSVSGGGSVASGPGLSPYTGSGIGTGTGSGPAGHISQFNPGQLTHGGSGPTTGATLQSTGTPPPTTTPPPTGNPGPSGPVGGPPNIPTVVPPGPKNPDDPSLQSLNEDNVPGPENTAAENIGPEEAAAERAAAEDSGAEGMEGIPGMGSAGQAASADAAGESLLSRESLAGADPEFAAASGAEAGAIGDEAAVAGTAEGEGMMPMTGAGGGKQNEKERLRQAWMNEDADIWGAPKASVGSVITD